MLRRIAASALTAWLIGVGSSAYAQQTQTTAEVKARPDPSPESGSPGFVEKAKGWAENYQLAERLSGDVDGWYPRLGGMTRGSGFAIGPGYRTHLFNDRVFVDLSAGVSTKGYKSADVNVRWWQGFGERVELWTDYRYEDFPQEDFFGLGFGSSPENRTSYDFASSEFTVRAIAKPMPWLRLGSTLGYMSPDIDPGADKKFPSIEQLFTDAQAPGLLDQPNFLHTTLFAEVEALDYPGNPRAGGFGQASLGFWDDRALQQFDHKRFDALGVYYLPLESSKTHVVSARIGTSYVNNETGRRVPFYFLPYVGGRDTIRSFREFRFKDENAAWVGAEYSYRPIKWVSFAVFADAGEVAPHWQDLDLRGMKKGYGFGIRVHSRTQSFGRIDFATGGGEGWQMFLKLGPSF